MHLKRVQSCPWKTHLATEATSVKTFDGGFTCCLAYGVTGGGGHSAPRTRRIKRVNLILKVGKGPFQSEFGPTLDFQYCLFSPPVELSN